MSTALPSTRSLAPSGPVRPSVLVVDPEPARRALWAAELRCAGVADEAVGSGHAALERARRSEPLLALVSAGLPDVLDVVGGLARRGVGVVVACGPDDLGVALAAWREGALDCLRLPPADRGRLAALARQRALARCATDAGFPARSPALQRIRRELALVAPESEPVLIAGETGVGKEVAARAIHALGPRSAGPFVAVNLCALPEGTLESELFGHERGAFTGASARRVGRFEQANGGTILLDEIGDASPRVQAELLRIVETRRFERVGGTSPIRTDARILAATHRDLPAEIAAGRFREDLWHRIAGFQVHIPPLRRRPEDVELLVELELARCARERARGGYRISTGALALLRGHPWPGNAREMRATVRRMALRAGPRRELDEADAEGALADTRRVVAGASPPEALASPTTPAEFFGRERSELLETLNAHRWNVSAAARQLGLSRGGLRNRMMRLGIPAPGQLTPP